MSAEQRMRTVAEICTEKGIDTRRLAELAGLDEGRAVAILLRRWTPSPEERAAVARALETTPDQIVLGHATPVQHIYGQGPA